MGERAENELRDETQFLDAERRLHALEDFGEDVVPESDGLFGLPGLSLFLCFPAQPLLFFFFPVAEMNLAVRVRTGFDEMAFLHPVCMNRGGQMVAEFVFGRRVLAFVVLPRDNFDVLAARQCGRIIRRAVVVRNLDQIRYFGDALRDVCVQFAIEARGIGALCGIGRFFGQAVWWCSASEGG